MKKRLLRLAIALLVSGGLLIVLVGQADLPYLLGKLADARMGPLLLAGVVAFAVLVLRGIRFAVLMDMSGIRSVGLMMAIMGVQNFLTRITPFRSGELIVPYLLKRHRGSDPGQVLLRLVWVRFVDLGVVVMVFVGAFGLYTSGLVGQRQVAFGLAEARMAGAAVALLLLVGGFVVTFRFWFSVGVSVAHKLAGSTGLVGVSFVERVLTKLSEARASMTAMSRRRVTLVVLWTVVTWVAQFAIAGLIIAAFEISVDTVDLAVGMSVAQFGAAVPVPSVGNIGPHETGWVLGFGLVGMARSDAVLTGLAAQLVTLAYALLLAAGCWIYLRRQSTEPGLADARGPNLQIG